MGIHQPGEEGAPARVYGLARSALPRDFGRGSHRRQPTAQYGQGAVFDYLALFVLCNDEGVLNYKVRVLHACLLLNCWSYYWRRNDGDESRLAFAQGADLLHSPAVEVDAVARIENVVGVVQPDAQAALHQVDALLGVVLRGAGDIAGRGVRARDEHFQPAAQVGDQQFDRDVAGRESNLQAFVPAHHRVFAVALREVEERDLQRLGDAPQRFERRAVDVALDQAEEAGSQPGAGGQVLQAQLEFLPAFA